ncbi:hypothetical protein [Streptomyces cavernae]|uniref:hypothetical protein n=1 Tax=Streptomyces cavernae TaxID=2259034 RepID=UPI0013915442|nr:hypothetical protein [Streptomyces cavernae]
MPGQQQLSFPAAVDRRAWRQHRVPVLSVALALPLYVLWARLLGTGGGDLAAQIAWSDFVARHPGSPYNLSWYGGSHVGGYSVLTPYLMAALGVRTVTVLAGLAASWFAAVLFVRSGMSRPLLPALLAVLTLWCNVASGRSTFAIGTAIGLAACLALTGSAPRAARQRPVLAALLSVLATLASPAAGLFLLVAGAGWLLAREFTQAAALLVPPVLTVAATTLLFPIGGRQPMGTGDIWEPLILGAVVVLVAPHDWRVVRLGTLVYMAGVVLALLVSSPVGSNVVRLAELFAPPVLLAALLAPGPHLIRRGALAVALAFSVNWVGQHAVDVLRMSTPVPAWATDTRGVVAALDRLGADRTRVEVVPAVNHRETTALAPYVNTARGWNRQLDVERGPLFYDGSFSARRYRAWLDRWAVGLVVLPQGTPDWAAEEEAALVRAEPDWLELVWRDEHWRVYRVDDATPLVTGPGSVVRSDGAGFTVRVGRPGSVDVRVAHSPWLRTGRGCLERAGEWTRLTVTEPGTYRISSSYRLPRQQRC